MKYSVVKLYPKDTPAANAGVGYYTHLTLESLVVHYGHDLIPVEAIDKETVLLVSICTLDSIPPLKKIREKYPDNIIITGGQFAFLFQVCLIFSDYACVGQGFDFFECDSIDEIKRLKCIAYHGKNELIEPSERIEWPLFPVAQTKKTHYYYMNGVGCHNKCKFCFTSWANRWQQNDQRRVQQVVDRVKERRGTVTLISNEYNEDWDVLVKDMMLKDFIRTQISPGGRPNLIRLGIEFAQEETRKKYGKHFTNEQFYFALEKAQAERKELNLFFITGLEPLHHLEDLLLNYGRMGTKPKIYVKLTNIVFNQHTPVWKERHSMNIDNYCTFNFGKELSSKLMKNGGWRFQMLTAGNPQKAIYETAMNHITTEEEYNFA